jgi:hypothetical protein
MWQQRVAEQQQQQQQEGQPPHRHQHQHKQQPQQQQQVLRHTPVQSNSSSSQSSDPSRASSRWDPQLLIARLQRDVVRCVHADRSYSPYCDMAKSLAGGVKQGKMACGVCSTCRVSATGRYGFVSAAPWYIHAPSCVPLPYAYRYAAADESKDGMR